MQAQPAVAARLALPALAWGRAALVLALLGATVGVGLDALHVHTHTTAYTHPWLFGIAWWVPLLFAGAGVVLGLSRVIVSRAAPSRRGAAIGFALFVVAYALSGFLPGVLCGAVLGAMAIATWFACERSAIGAVMALLGAVGGTGVEITLVRAGAFHYLASDFLGVPLWLPCLYLCASMGIGAMARVLAARS